MVLEKESGAGTKQGVPRLELRGIEKSFPGCKANAGIDLTIRPGEIHALLGENGAGKSTLVKIIYGILHADAGSITWEGEATHIAGPSFARNLGIGMVFQHFSLFEALTVAENIALGVEGEHDMGRLEARIEEVSTAYGLPLEPRRHVHSLSVGERQRIEIVRCLLQNPRLLIMDEPTSVLTPQEVETLFGTLRRLSAEGCSILYISHKLDEIRQLCDMATVLRGGKLIGVCDPKQESAKSLARMMIGDDVKEPRQLGNETPGAMVLSVADLSLQSRDPFGTDLKAVTFNVHAGEIFGIAGIAGNGQNELLAALSGEELVPDSAAVVMSGQAAGRLGPRHRRALGLSFVPEERHGHGAVPALNLIENAFLSAHLREKLVRWGLIDFAKTRTYAQKICETFDVRTSGVDAEASSLSGGNLQKFIIGREILQRPSLMIAAQPTWGVDAGAAAAIHQALIDLAASGTAVLVVSQELDELFAITDRIAVMSAGHLSAARSTRATTLEEIGLLMGGDGRRAEEPITHVA